MSLAGVIQDILDIPDVSNATKDMALKEVIEAYRTKTEYMKKDKRITDIAKQASVKYNPAIERVIAGKTTYMKEFRKQKSHFLITGNNEITGGNFDMEKQIKLVDETIQRLYQN